MSAHAEPGNSPSLRYWKAAIASLTPEKRDAAWEFYLRHFAEGKSGDTLSALVLLMEANGVFLERLPERYHEELISPLKAQLLALQHRIAEHEQHQREIVTSLERVSRQNVDASARALSTAVKVEGSLRDAATAVDAHLIVEGVKFHIMENALMPLARQLQKLASTTTRIDDATKSAGNAVETWRRIHLRGLVFTGWGVGLVIFLILFIFAWRSLKENADRHVVEMRDQLTSDLRKNQETLRKLAEAGVSLQIVPAADSAGKTTQDSLIVEPAEGADFDGQHRAVVYLKPAIKSGSFSNPR